MLTGRYPFGAGFYDMSNDPDHCTVNYTALPEMLKSAGYRTHALGKWDMGGMVRECSPTYRGFDTFFGYYGACQGDYWYHTASGGYPHKCAPTTDLSNSTGKDIRPATRPDLNGTYNRNLFSGEAARLIRRHGALFPDDPMYMYLAFMNIHDGCGNLTIGKQAPLKTVELYPDTQLDTYKVAGAMITELDYGVAEALAALRDAGMYDNTLVIIVSDNGGPLDHATNAPLRDGKHTFFEGGVRVMALLGGGWLPRGLRGKRWTGMAHASDWYFTLVEGVAGGKVPANTGPRAPDGHNLWPALLDAAKGNGSDWSPRNEVVHQVENQYFSEGVASMRLGKYKIITGKNGPGDSRTIAWPDKADAPVPLGRSGALVIEGTDHVYAPGVKGPFDHVCVPMCLFDLEADIGEQNDLSGDSKYAQIVANITARLNTLAATGPPPAWLFAIDQAPWINTTVAKATQQEQCDAAGKRGFLEPVDF